MTRNRFTVTCDIFISKVVNVNLEAETARPKQKNMEVKI